MYPLQECANGANSADVTSLTPSDGEQDDSLSDTAAIVDGDDEGPPTIEIPVASIPPQRLRVVECVAGLMIIGLLVVGVTILVNGPAESPDGTALPQAGMSPRVDAGIPPTLSNDSFDVTGTPDAQPSVTGSAVAASLSPSPSVSDVPREPVQPVPPAQPPVISLPSPAEPPPEAELRAIYSTVERTGRARLRGQVVVSNVSDTTAVGWQVTIRLPAGATLSDLDGVDFEQTGSTVRFTPRGNKRRIAPGGSVRFTFDVRKSKGGEPTSCFINDRPCG